MKTLVDFYADWCGPCIAMKPVIEKIEKEYASKLVVKKVNVDEQVEEATKYGIVSIPTFLILNEDGEVIAKRLGAVPSDQFIEWVKSNL